MFVIPNTMECSTCWYMKILYYVFLFFYCIRPKICTIDINLSELQYLADHLHKEECIKLFTSLHFTSDELPSVLKEAENKVPSDVTCLELLIHWNTTPGEGKGETHEVLMHRLRQIERDDLAEWLGKTVFHQLGEDLEKDLKESFDEFQNVTVKTHKYQANPTFAPPVSNADPLEWSPFDTICWVLAVGITLTICVMSLKLVYERCCKRNEQKTKTKPKRRFLNKRKYHQLKTEESSSESEDSLDVKGQII